MLWELTFCLIPYVQMPDNMFQFKKRDIYTLHEDFKQYSLAINHNSLFLNTIKQKPYKPVQQHCQKCL